ncbi:uncharacterized protein J4E84_003553 [Alternaria hordeiaustralica]|uniref:uncharacterized protein n=1 Tax=Alternaria hordeiaustralica TaxID=1187925 RepID=UPI0020C1FADD|nr:uncharacterized protein J4E84_003553 [Alternaria hordeiaustralica]KAI4691262.1 hypothetical protein J4E84_003553 [Alternaria hordeiaustralica]
MSTTSPVTGDVVATLLDGNSFQSAQHATIPHPVGCECSNSYNVLDTNAPVQLASGKETTGTHIATNNEPGDSKKRQNEAHQEEQEAANKRRNLNDSTSEPSHKRTIARTRRDAKHAEAVEEGRITCLQLCAKLHTTLPRELRDMVYSETIGPHDRENVTGHHVDRKHAIQSPAMDFINHGIRSLKSTEQRGLKWWLDSYMGREVATEIVEQFYRSRTFCFSRRRSGLIPDFLKHDVFSKGLEPGLFVQHMHAHVGEFQIETSYFDELKDILGKIKNKDVNLHIRLHHRTSMSARRLQLEKLGPVVYQLRREGLSRVTVQSSGCCKDFTSLFDVQEGLFLDHLEKWALTANPNI